MGNEASTPNVPQPTPLIEDHLLIWTDGSIGENDKDSQGTLSELHKVVKKVETCTKPEQCIKLLNGMNNEKVLVICSGSLGKDLVSQIHHMPNLVGIYIFCGNEALHTEWTTNWPKIKLVSTKIGSICDAMKKELIDSKPKKEPELPVNKDTPNEQVSNPQFPAKKNEDHTLDPGLNQKKSENTDNTDNIAGKSVAGESDADESNAGETNASEYAASKSVAGESNAGESVASKSVAGESVTSKYVAGESDADESNAGESNASEYVASKSVAGESNADESNADESNASESVASKSVAGNLNDTPLFKKNAIFISGLPSTMMEQLLFNTLYDEFGTVGPIKIDTQTNKSCIFLFRSKKNNDQLSGNAEITFENEEAVEEAIKKYNQMCVPALNSTRIDVKQSKMKPHASQPQKAQPLPKPIGPSLNQESSEEESESTDDTNSVTSGSVVGEPGVDKRGTYKPSVRGLANAGLFKKNTIFIHGLPSTMPEQLLFNTLRDAFCTVGRIKVTIKHVL
ncbi:unnamed protein product [Adineta steineri]|uniref:RRM domain-containing protein n=1 Tax=Adineta steineri TaxID=433720 RepID=A0A819CVK9_9BILA|nr:unnamed protein product [Adineta steineri]